MVWKCVVYKVQMNFLLVAPSICHPMNILAHAIQCGAQGVNKLHVSLLNQGIKLVLKMIKRLEYLNIFTYFFNDSNNL